MKVLLFGILSDYIQQEDVPWNTFNTIASLELFLKNKFPKLEGIPIQFAVNQQFVTSGFILDNVEELALMPPFSGG